MVEFNVKDLLVTVQTIEGEVAELYSELSKKVNGKAKKVFEKLSKDELRHQKMYSDLISKLDNDGSYMIMEKDVDFLKQMVSGSPFTNPEIKKRYVKEDALILAEKIEKDGIILYQELKNIIPELNNEKIDRIIDEEKAHLKVVMDMQFNASLPNLML